MPSLEQIRTIDLLNTNHLIYSLQDSEIWATALSDTEGSDSNWLIGVDAQTGTILRRRPPDKGTHLNGLWLSPDHSKLLVAGEDTLSVLDAHSWELLHLLEIPIPPSAMRQGGMSQPVLAFAPDSGHLAVGHDSLSAFVIVNCKTWEIASQFDLPEHWYVRVCAFTPDGRYMACASYENHNEVKLFDFSDRLETS